MGPYSNTASGTRETKDSPLDEMPDPRLEKDGATPKSCKDLALGCKFKNEQGSNTPLEESMELTAFMGEEIYDLE